MTSPRRGLRSQLSSRASESGVAPKRVLVTGYLSTAGDVEAQQVLCSWLASRGAPYDVAPFNAGVIAAIPGARGLETLEPVDYSHVVFVCGPMIPRERLGDFFERYRHCWIGGLNLSIIESLEDWNPFDFRHRLQRLAVHLRQHEDPSLGFGQLGERTLERGVELLGVHRCLRAGSRVGHFQTVIQRSQLQVAPLLLVQQPPVGDGEDPGGQLRRTVGGEARDDAQQLLEQLLGQIVGIWARARAADERVHHGRIAAQEEVLRATIATPQTLDGEPVQLHGS